MRVLITGMRAPAAMEWARRFHEAEHDLIGADCLAAPLGRFSSAVDQYIRLPSPVTTPSAFRIALEDLVEKREIDLIVPTCEEVFHVAMLRSKLACHVFADGLETLDSLHSKRRFSRSRSAVALAPAPPTHPLRSNADARRFIDTAQQWVFKPEYSRFASRTMIGASRWRLEQLKPSDRDPWIAQQRIEGRELCTFTLADHGEVFAHAAYETPYRAGKGAGIYFQPIEHSVAQQAVAEIIVDCQFTGQLGCDFIEDLDGKLWVIEANPRATSGLHLLPRDPSLIHRLMQTFNPVKAVSTIFMPTSETQPAMVAAAMPLWGVISALQNGRTSIFRDFWNAQDVVGSLQDSLPWVGAPLAMMELLLLSIRTGQSPTQASTADIQWNGDHPAPDDVA